MAQILHIKSSKVVENHKLRNFEEILGATLATITGYSISEAVFWALLSGVVGAGAAHLYKILIAPKIEKLINFFKKCRDDQDQSHRDQKDEVV